ncbi:pentapeptide repeat-containing protein [Streptomyces aculeolatus]
MGAIDFSRATFEGGAAFRWTTVESYAIFRGANFQRDAVFSGATFQRDAVFSGATFEDGAVFSGAIFERASRVGPLTCRETVDFSAAVFGAAVIVQVSARGLVCRRTRWASTATLRLRHAAVDLSDVVLEYPVSVTAHATTFRWQSGEKTVDESGIEPTAVRIQSLRGVDAAHLSLTDVDLTECRFAGTVHLDQLRLYGRCPMAPAPDGWHRRGPLPARFTTRQTLAEEHHWRAGRAHAAAGWMPPPDSGAPLEPAALVPLYRELRKAFEDGKDEPGAADFYYGEMEMRRHDPRTPAAERFLLRLYWALSGYGLRASRALGWLLAAMFTTVVLMMLWGLPKEVPEPVSAGTVAGRSVTLTTDTPAPQNPDSPYGERLSTERFDPAIRVVINSVVFRSSGQDLTTFGTYTEMASRFTEPVLLGLAALAIRNRVKR